MTLRDDQWFATTVNFQITPLLMDELSEDTASFPACKAIACALLQIYSISQAIYASVIPWYA